MNIEPAHHQVQEPNPEVTSLQSKFEHELNLLCIPDSSAINIDLPPKEMAQRKSAEVPQNQP